MARRRGLEWGAGIASGLKGLVEGYLAGRELGMKERASAAEIGFGEAAERRKQADFEYGLTRRPAAEQLERAKTAAAESEYLSRLRGVGAEFEPDPSGIGGFRLKGFGPTPAQLREKGLQSRAAARATMGKLPDIEALKVIQREKALFANPYYAASQGLTQEDIAAELAELRGMENALWAKQYRGTGVPTPGAKMPAPGGKPKTMEEFFQKNPGLSP